MRITKILTVAAAALVVSATTSQAATYDVEVAPAVTAVVAPMTLAVVQDPPPVKADIKVDLDDDANTVWYTDPVWLAVGAIALLIVIVLAVMAARGGSDRTTVVR